jgi:hypothetical protein
LLCLSPMNRLIVACFAALPLVACVNEPVASMPSTNRDMDVDLLFTHDGCSVYRFKDGTYHYYVRCDGVPAEAAAATLSCRSKGCGYDDTIPTLASPR